MVIYRVPQSDLDEVIKERIVSVVRFYTIKYGGVDVDKINPTTLLSRFSIRLADAKRLLPELLAEEPPRIEEVS